MNDSEMIFSIVIWLVIIASLIYLLIRKIIKDSEITEDELNKVIAEQRGTTIAGLALKDPNEMPEGTTVQEAGSVSEMPKTTNVQAEAQAARVQAPDNGVLSDEDLAASYRSQADRLFKEAKSLREQAEELVPTKKKSKASAEAAS